MLKMLGPRKVTAQSIFIRSAVTNYSSRKKGNKRAVFYQGRKTKYVQAFSIPLLVVIKKKTKECIFEIHNDRRSVGMHRFRRHHLLPRDGLVHILRGESSVSCRWGGNSMGLHIDEES